MKRKKLWRHTVTPANATPAHALVDRIQILDRAVTTTQRHRSIRLDSEFCSGGRRGAELHYSGRIRSGKGLR